MIKNNFIFFVLMTKMKCIFFFPSSFLASSYISVHSYIWAIFSVQTHWQLHVQEWARKTTKCGQQSVDNKVWTTFTVLRSLLVTILQWPVLRSTGTSWHIGKTNLTLQDLLLPLLSSRCANQDLPWIVCLSDIWFALSPSLQIAGVPTWYCGPLLSCQPNVHLMPT